jgi:hypothetical protein
MHFRVMSLVSIVALAIFSSHAIAKGERSSGSKADSGSYRSAKSGQYVKKDYAQKNRDTTVRERRN